MSGIPGSSDLLGHRRHRPNEKDPVSVGLVFWCGFLAQRARCRRPGGLPGSLVGEVTARRYVLERHAHWTPFDPAYRASKSRHSLGGMRGYNGSNWWVSTIFAFGKTRLGPFQASGRVESMGDSLGTPWT